MIHQPVGVVSVVTRHWEPATNTLPAATPRRAAGFRGAE